MSVVVPRTVTVVERAPGRAPAMGRRPQPRQRSAPLEECRSARAYVLLGDPGAGKTTAFQAEAGADRDGSEFVTARRFISRSLEHHPEWWGKTLFLDGLDEVRAGRRDGRTPLDHILNRLEKLGRPDFRLTCRAADWLGSNDLREIVATAGYENVCVLQLDPLTDADISRIISSLGEENPGQFVGEASARGLGGLLSNPHLLRLAVKAMGAPVGAGQTDPRPRGRLDLLKSACRALARERNEEHRAVHRASPGVSTKRILSAAGHVSALLLLSDRDFVSLDETDDPDALCLGSIEEGDRHALLRALKSNLFAGTRDGFAPVHRQLAEFLGARFLRDRIKSGLPASRVLALIAGEDGGVVTELRGLSAWLAAFEPASREALIETDPIGITLYGDVGRFRQDEVEGLFDALAQKTDEIRPWSWPPIALASLIGPHTVSLLNRYLGNADRSEGRRAVVGLMLHALSGAEGVSVCRKSLEGAVRDAAWGQSVRDSALRALLHHSRNHDSWMRPLVALLDDLRDGTIDDRDRTLLGRLLKALYPEYVGPEQIWDYLVPARKDGHYGFFWLSLPEKSRKTNLFPLMQSLVARGPEVWGNLAYNHLPDIADRLIQEMLKPGGDFPVPTLYDWLELVNSQRFHHGASGHSALCRWLAARPALQKEVALEGLGRHSGHEDSQYRTWKVWEFVFRAGRPAGFPEWCLQQAIETAGNRMDTAVALLDWSGLWHDGDTGAGLSTEDVLAATGQIPELRRAAEKRIDAQKEHERRLQVREARQVDYQHEQRRKESQFVGWMRGEAQAFREGMATPGLMHEVAEAYHGLFPKNRADTPRERVAILLGGDADLADAAIAGFRRVAGRADLPSLRDLIRLNQQEMRSLLALPLLAGLDASEPEWLDYRSPAEISRAAGVYLLTTLTGSSHPAWYQRALDVHPEAVAEGLVKVTRARIRGKRECLYLWALPRESVYASVARLAVFPLLRAFPTRCTEPQVSALHEVLLAAVRWEVDGVEEFIRQRLAKTDLDVAQRALWLVAGLCMSPEKYAAQVAEFVERGEEARSQHVVRFLAPDHMEQRRMSWGTGELKALVELLGSRYSPWRPESVGVATVVDEDRERVEILIAGWADTLASRTDVEACEVLQSLAEDSRLEAWHQILRDKRDGQVVARRTATFAVPDLAAVQRTLANKEPSNAADLAALVADRLEELGEHMGRDNTDDWRQYWKTDSHRKPIDPDHEESCRDALLSDLRLRLPEAVDAQPEARHARGSRADIRVSFRNHGIPIEIKKHSHPRLWSAVMDQLVAKYSVAPDSSGFGIYLVLWFEPDGTPVPPTGRRPKTPGALRERLEEQLSGRYRHKIRVIVIDVSGSVQRG